MIALLVSALMLQQAPARPIVNYEISFPNAAHHEAQVSVTYTQLPARPLELRMSRSSPGRYALHEFAKNVYEVKAFDSNGKALPITRPNEHQWNVNVGADRHVKVSYTLYADRADGTYSGIDRTHAHLNMPATFMFARNTFDRPVRIKFNIPAGSNWKVATQLEPTSDPTVFGAPHLQYFFDSPTEISNYAVRTWTVPNGQRSETIRLVMHHAGTDAELDAYTEQVKKVVLEQQAIFGQLPSFDFGTYTFIADYLPWVAGDGMEHRNSTILASTGSLAQNAGGLLGTVSHEFFHAWNVERIRPRTLEPFDFERANMSEELWFAEGFTSYYGPLAIKRAGITSLDDYARAIGFNVATVLTAPGRNYFSAAEMSMQAPFVDAATSIDPQNRSNTFISYYTYGAAIGLGLDLLLRTEKESSLDDFMRAMWARHGRTERAYTLNDWRITLGQVVRDTGWADSFFFRHITGKQPIDFRTLLGRAGLQLRNAGAGQPSLGAVAFTRDTASATVSANTLVGSPMYVAGVDRGDRIVSLDGKPVKNSAEIDAIVATHKPGDEIPITFESRGQQLNGRVKLAEREQLEIVTYEKAGMAVTDEMKALREAWLESKVRN
ncbi:MAG TPA: PDZ domain-containing protein [Longimicrobiales bacterium]